MQLPKAKKGIFDQRRFASFFVICNLTASHGERLQEQQWDWAKEAGELLGRVLLTVLKSCAKLELYHREHFRSRRKTFLQLNPPLMHTKWNKIGSQTYLTAFVCTRLGRRALRKRLLSLWRIACDPNQGNSEFWHNTVEKLNGGSFSGGKLMGW